MFASDSRGDAVEHARHGRLADLGLASSAPSSVQVARRPGGARARGSRFCVARRGSASVGNLRRSSPGSSSMAVAGLLCRWYAPAMLVLCACYASAMRLLCVYYASTMRLLCACYAPAMRVVCGCYASAMRPLCGCYAAAMLVYAVAGVCLVVGPLCFCPGCA